MIMIGMTMRVDELASRGERRDAIDQSWISLIASCGYMPILLPNHLPTVQEMLRKLPIRGMILTGGNDLLTYGGSSPERDEVERFLIQYACDSGAPLLGVCRGMQMLQDFWGIELEKIEGHVALHHAVYTCEGSLVKNSYHQYGARRSVEELIVTARAADGIIEAIMHKEASIKGMMWHPEREMPFEASDMSMIKQLFGGENENE
ncbi:gamma-glutamyl-gamma-aminobutyrate hydrolase family protein [Paenibacillus sp. KS-LC4]|uniref:gamma-glutamyl-gamma-aminobutyrate hydrolase family protein n=1 Tax=Paenibacillus sp. KS-LC4 TaxID=2979727 RepID=UPI0030CE9BD7